MSSHRIDKVNEEIKKELSGSQPRDVLEEAISQVMFGE